MAHKIQIALIVILLQFNLVYAQEKYEKESRLKPESVPAKAIKFIDSLGTNTAVKWYLEEALESSSIEAKFIHKAKKYSVEFDTLGSIEDVEVEINWTGITMFLQDSIRTILNSECENFKVRKAQIQYSGSRSELLSLLQTKNDSLSCIVRYELIVKCSTSEEVALYEFLFSDEGEKLSRSKIVFKNSSNLEY